jgi:uncharacterized protein
MKYVVENAIIGIEDSEREIRNKLAKRLSIPPESFRYEITKRSLDIVDGSAVYYVKAIVDTNSFIRDTRIGFFGPTETLIIQPQRFKSRPLIVGAGLAGLFAAYVLAKAKLKPIVIEQGSDGNGRDEEIARFESGDPNLASSYGIGLGGYSGWCGGFSNSEHLDSYGQFALDTFIELGAPKALSLDGNAYLSPGESRKIIDKLVGEIVNLGGEVLLNTKMIGLLKSFGKVKGVQVLKKGDKKETIKSKCVILATGVPRRELLSALTKAKVKLEAKSFYLGVMAEINGKDVDAAVYGSDVNKRSLPSFRFSKDLRTSSGRKAKIGYLYPNGRVFNNATKGSEILLSSGFPNSNTGNYVASIMVKIGPKDFSQFGESDAFPFLNSFYGSLYHPSSPLYAPCETLADLLAEEEPMKLGKVKTSYYPGVYLQDLSSTAPAFLEKDLLEAVTYFSSNFPGIKPNDVIISGFTSGRTSPFKVSCDEESLTSLKGLFSALPAAQHEESILDEARRGIVCAFSLLNQD